MKRKLKVKNWILLFIFLISTIIVIFSFIKLINWIVENEQIKSLESDVLDAVEIIEIEDNENTEVINHEEVDSSDPYWDYIKMDLIDVDFTNLKSINEDVKGWIKVNGTNINYPFVQTEDNKYYLNHAFNKSYNTAGWVFLDYRNDTNYLNKNTILYAHGRLNNTMFGSLKNILKSSWYNDINNHVINISTETESSLWQVFSVYRIPTTNDYIQINFSDDQEYIEFLKLLQNRSNFAFNTSVNANDKIITLSTCYNNDEKVVLHAKLIKRTIKN